MNRKGFIFQLILLVAFLVLLVACGNNPQPAGTEEQPASEPESAEVDVVENEATGGVSLDQQLIEAVNAEDAAEVGRLLEEGADPNVTEGDDFFSNPVLRTAVMDGNFEIAEQLLAAGADANARDSKGNSILRRAITQSHANLVDLLLENGADATAIEGDDNALLPLAVQTGDLAITQMLIDAGAGANDEAKVSFNVGNFNMEFPGPGIHVAAARGNVDIISLLIEHGADVNQSVEIDGYNSWQPLTFAALGNQLETIQLLFENGALIDGSTPVGNPLSWAIYGNHPAAVQLLVDLGANVNIDFGEEQTLLQKAQVEANEEIIQMLLAAGAEE